MQVLFTGARRAGLAVAFSAFLPLAAQAAVAVSWLAPANNSAFLAGTPITLTGAANASGIAGGTGLDLALVLDSSGSMTINELGKTRQQWQREAAIALVNALPQNTTSVAVIDFDSVAHLDRVLTPLNPSKAQVISAINGVDALGQTNIGAGITAGATELLGARGTAGRTQIEIVITDGQSNVGNSLLATQNAITAGVDAIYTVGLPGSTPTELQNIATAGNGTFTNSVANVGALAALFAGTAGNLVGIDHVDVTLANGTFLGSVGLDGLGNFQLPNVTLNLGDNLFKAEAFDSVGNSASSYLHVTGIAPAVPEPSTWAAMAACLGVLGAVMRKGRVAV
jgi:Ca-activated chloride channel family protein